MWFGPGFLSVNDVVMAFSYTWTSKKRNCFFSTISRINLIFGCLLIEIIQELTYYVLLMAQNHEEII